MKIYTRLLSEFSQEEYNKYFQMMSEERKSAVLRKKFESSRKASVLGEAMARKTISEITNIAEDKIIFNRTENGKPYCENVDIHFSISHSKDMVVFAVDSNKIGVDVEFIKEIDFRITKFACNPQDMAIFESTQDEKEKRDIFFKIWTAKEAYIKYHGKILADIRDVVYEELLPHCKVIYQNGYIISIYR